MTATRRGSSSSASSSKHTAVVLKSVAQISLSYESASPGAEWRKEDYGTDLPSSRRASMHSRVVLKLRMVSQSSAFWNGKNER